MPARLRAALLLAALLALVPTADVGATSPGANGLIAVGTEPAPPAKDRRVSLTRPDGEPAGALAGDLADLGDFRWSPDGARLVGFYYDPYRDPHAPALRPFGWYVVTRDGKAWTALPDATRSASFLPDGRVLLLQGGSASVPEGSLWTVSADGSGLERALPGVTVQPFAFDFQASPDGRAAYYLVTGDEESGAPDAIWRVDLATGAQRSVYSRPAAGGTATVFLQDVSPDGRSLLLLQETISEPGGPQPGVLVVVGVDGGGSRTLPTRRGGRPTGRFSPDGRLVAYLTTAATYDGSPQGDVELRVVRVDGGGDLPLASFPGSSQNGFTGLAWQPLRRVVISGVVAGAGAAAAPTRAGARATVVASGSEGTFRTQVDARGRFALEVEPGRYRLAVQGRTGCVIIAGACASTQLVDATRNVTVRVLADPRGTKLALGLVGGARLTVSRGKVAIPVRCVATKACTGSVALRRGRTTIATRRVTVRPGKTLRVKLAVGKRRGTMTARATAGGRTAAVSVRVG